VNERPTKAQVSFSMDPWGRVNGDFAQEPFSRRYNARWRAMVVNLVGTGILDCTKAADRSGCYSQPFVRMGISHVGPAWVSDFNQRWTALGIPLGRVEGGKALAAEEWLDPVANSWSRPFVQSVARSELLDRPFGGLYRIELEVGPEVRLDRIERVQLLAGSTYWVKQQ
jgi:hypothetical protein